MVSLSAFSAQYGLHSSSLLRPSCGITQPWASVSVSGSRFFLGLPMKTESNFTSVVNSSRSDPNSDSNPGQISEVKPRKKHGPRKSKVSQSEENTEKHFPPMVAKKPRRGRKSEAAAVEDYVRGSLERTFSSIRQQNPDIMKNMEKIMKDKVENDVTSNRDVSDDNDDSDETQDGDSGKKEMLVEEDDPDWPLDADVGWGIRASEYFEQHPIRNVVDEDGSEIDWEGEIDYGLVKEINCLEWESFAFHPSPLIVLVFERYNQARDNWKVLKELEKAAMVFWKAKDRLPPRTVKIDINIERDLAYALKVKECPQILFLRGNKILYREKDFRSADELVQMIAHFYYNAKKPPCIKDEMSSPTH